MGRKEAGADMDNWRKHMRSNRSKCNKRARARVRQALVVHPEDYVLGIRRVATAASRIGDLRTEDDLRFEQWDKDDDKYYSSLALDEYKNMSTVIEEVVSGPGEDEPAKHQGDASIFQNETRWVRFPRLVLEGG